MVIALGSMQQASLSMQIIALSTIALLITIGVYGLVAAIVKLDDLGLYLLRKSVSGSFNALQRQLGRALLIFAPILMKTLSVAGTIAMFLVGGGILTHSFASLHHTSQWLVSSVEAINLAVLPLITSISFDGLVGLLSGAAVVLGLTLINKLRAKLSAS